MNNNEKIVVGLSPIRSARRQYLRVFWEEFFGGVLGIEPVFSESPVSEAFETGKKFLGNDNSFCFFRCLDIGQHVDLIDKGCNYLILMSLRETGKRACSTENYVGEHLAAKYPDVKILNVFLDLDDEEGRNKELRKLASYFTNDAEKMACAADKWPREYVDNNLYFSRYKKEKINLLILGDMYDFLNPHMEHSYYVDMLCNKLNCNIITPTDIPEKSLREYKKAYQKIKELLPDFQGKYTHYWKSIKRLHTVDILIGDKIPIDGVLLVSDIWCEMFKEEAPLIIKILEDMSMPYYNLIFNMDGLSTIDTILESFVETLTEKRRRMEDGDNRD